MRPPQYGFDKSNKGVGFGRLNEVKEPKVRLSSDTESTPVPPPFRFYSPFHNLWKGVKSLLDSSDIL